MQEDVGTRRDVVVIGGSMGSLAPIRNLRAALPESLDAAIVIVLHRSASADSKLTETLNTGGFWCAHDAVDLEPIERGRVYVAPADHHLLISGDRGAAGVSAIKRAGGLVGVQMPSDALAAEMPETALASTSVDHVVPARDMPQLLVQLTGSIAPAEQPPRDIVIEAQVAERVMADMGRAKPIGSAHSLAVPAVAAHSRKSTMFLAGAIDVFSVIATRPRRYFKGTSKPSKMPCGWRAEPCWTVFRCCSNTTRAPVPVTPMRSCRRCERRLRKRSIM